MMNIGAGIKKIAGIFAVMLLVAAVCGMLATAGCETPADGQSSGGALDTVWKVANSPAAIAAIGGLLAFGLGKLYLAKPGWKKYEGFMISAIKQAEKAIPPGTPNAGAAKLDLALQYVIQLYEKYTEKTLSDSEKAVIAQGLSKVHDEVVAECTLGGAAPAAAESAAPGPG